MQNDYEKRYLENLDYFKKFHNEIYLKLINFNQEEKYALTLQEYKIKNKIVKSENIEILSTAEMAYKENPIQNAKDLAANSLQNDRWLKFTKEQEDSKNISKIIFVSNGLGLHLKEYDKKFSLKSVLIVENDIELFRLSTFCIDYEKFSKNKQLLFCVDEPYSVLEFYIMKFYHSLFFYNKSIKVSECFYSSTMQDIANILKTNIDKPLWNNKEYSKILSSQKIKINKDNFLDLMKKVQNSALVKKELNVQDILIIISLMDNINKIELNKVDYDQILNYLFLFLYTAYKSISKNHQIFHEELYIHSIRYLILVEKTGQFDKELYKMIIYMTNALSDDENYEYFQERFIEYLKREENRTKEEKEFISHQIYTLQALKGEQLSKSSKVYVEQEFNRFAQNFEKVLLNSLEYQTPKVLSTNIKKYINKEMKYDILDLGCGTGLLAEQLIDISKDIIGVDLSSEMLNVANGKKIYKELVNMDIEEYLSQTVEIATNMVVSSDVFIYIGELNNIFNLVSKKLKKDSLFAFSIELLEDDSLEYRLNTTGRFSQSTKYIQNLSEKYNFSILEQLETIIRKNKNEDIDGIIYLLKRN